MRYITIVSVLFILLYSTPLIAQNTDRELRDFIISVVEKDNQIVLNCEKGCAWMQLTYRNTREVQGIDFYGMVDKANWESKDHNGLFFKIKKDRSNKYSLTGVEGTAWLELGFGGYTKAKRFDQFGTDVGGRD